MGREKGRAAAAVGTWVVAGGRAKEKGEGWGRAKGEGWLGGCGVEKKGLAAGVPNVGVDGAAAGVPNVGVVGAAAGVPNMAALRLPPPAVWKRRKSRHGLRENT